jgi:WD40 repeat protein
MKTLDNENILKLIFNNYALFRAQQMLKVVNNRILTTILNRLLSCEKIFTSIGQTKTILEDDKNIHSFLTLLPNGNIISSSSNTCPKIWDINTHSCVKITTLNSYTGTCHALANGNIVLLTKGRIQILKALDDFKSIFNLQIKTIYNNLYNPILLSNGNLALNARCIIGTKTYIINLKKANEYKELISEQDVPVRSMINLEKGKFATSSYVFIKVWDVENNFKCFKNFEAHDDFITCLLFTNGLLISGSQDNTIKVWLDYICVNVINAHEGYANSLLVLPGGYFASGSDDGKIKIWDLKDFACVNVLVGHEGEINNLILLKDKRIVSDSHDELIIWNY